MGLSKTFALLGFLPDIEIRIKKIIQGHLDGFSISWVSATDPTLQGVVINADFLTSPQITKYIQRTKAKVVCCYRDAEGERQAELHQIPALNITKYDAEMISKWLSDLSSSTVKVKQSQIAVVDPIQSVTDELEEVVAARAAASERAGGASAIYTASKREAELQAKAKNTPSSTAEVSLNPRENTAKPARSAAQYLSKSTLENSRVQAAVKETERAAASESAAKAEGFSNDYNELLDRLEKGTGCYVARSGTHSAWIDRRNNIVYLDFDRDQISGIDRLNWEEVERLDPPRFARRLQYELWLFESIWQSNVNYNNRLSANEFYKLSRWPRPLSANGRSEALRLAAFIQSHPANIAQLQNKTGYDNQVVTRFLYAAKAADQMHVVKMTQQQQASLAQEQAKKPDKEKLGLLGKLRRKLGLG